MDPLRVLVVDDDPAIRGLCRYLLEDEGHEVIEAIDGRRGLIKLADDPPDIVVLDLMMPSVSGFDLLHQRRLQRLAPDSRIIVLTARTAAGTWRRAFEAGADDYLAKPFPNERLGAKIAELAAFTPAELSYRRRKEQERLDLMGDIEGE